MGSGEVDKGALGGPRELLLQWNDVADRVDSVDAAHYRYIVEIGCEDPQPLGPGGTPCVEVNPKLKPKTPSPRFKPHIPSVNPTLLLVLEPQPWSILKKCACCLRVGLVVLWCGIV